MTLTDGEKLDLLAAARSTSLREDLGCVTESRINPFVKDGEVDGCAVTEFLTQYNEFLNHPRKPHLPFREANMKL